MDAAPIVFTSVLQFVGLSAATNANRGRRVDFTKLLQLRSLRCLQHKNNRSLCYFVLLLQLLRRKLVARKGSRSICLSCLLLVFSGASLIASQDKSDGSRIGPVYVSLDSWIYPALKRLAAMGYVPDEEGLVMPWTRQQCRLFIQEAEDIASRHSMKQAAGLTNKAAQSIIQDLRREFPEGADATDQLRVESVYSRFSQIAGTPLRDSYHFGQTIGNDYGRPYDKGSNAIEGFSGYGTWGRLSGYLRGEYQQAGGRPAYDLTTRNLIGALDGVAPRSAKQIDSTRRFDPLEMYLGVDLGIFDITFGKQSLWWGPGETSAFHFSNNAEPIYSLRIAQQTPIVLPGPLHYLGHIRTQLMLGRLVGHQYPARPLMNAEKITFQLTPSLELGFTRSAIFGGVGHPLTTGSFFRSFFGVASTGGTAVGSPNDPGDRRSGFDFLWRVPGLRRFVTIYSDSLADDEPNPLDSPRRSAWAPGLYITQVPHLRNMDFRFETYSTWLYRKDEGGMFLYWNDQYRDAYTNDHYLLGSWVGRDARAYVVSSSYWWTGKNKWTAQFRQTKTGSNFLPSGGTQTDVSVDAQWELRRNLVANVSAQYERYLVPSLNRAPQHDVTAGLNLTFYPGNWAIKR